MKTILYVDSFNLYFRLLRKHPQHRWLNLQKLAENVLSQRNDVVGIKYYSARVSGRVDPKDPRHQQIYLNALETLPNLSVHMGMFLTSEKWASLIHPPQFQPEQDMQKPWPDVVRVLKTEEKGSDVNLATHLLWDGVNNAYDAAIVLSNDTDLVEPIRLVRQELGKVVGIMSPVRSPSPDLRKAASFVRRIRSVHLEASQFESPLPLPDGTTITKPENWT